MLRESLLRRRLEERGRSPALILTEETGSTNTDAKEYAKSGGPVPALFAADRQTAGRGRMGKTFASPPGGLYMSLLLPAPPETGGTVCVTGCAAAAACLAVEEIARIPARIKWVNDILVPAGTDGSLGKAAGILCETTESDGTRFLVIGIGVNLTAAPPLEGANFPAAAVSRPDRPVEAEALCAALTDGFFKIAESGFDFSAAAGEYRSRSAVIGRTVVFAANGQSRTGTARAVLDDGSLLVETAAGPVTLSSGEISVRLA